MTQRIFSQLKIDQLEKLFDEKRGNVDFLTSLLAELSHRRVPRAKALHKRVMQALALGIMASTGKSNRG